MIRVLIPGMDSEATVTEKVVNGLKETVLFDGSNYENYQSSIYIGISDSSGGSEGGRRRSKILV